MTLYRKFIIYLRKQDEFPFLISNESVQILHDFFPAGNTQLSLPLISKPVTPRLRDSSSNRPFSLNRLPTVVVKYPRVDFNGLTDSQLKLFTCVKISSLYHYCKVLFIMEEQTLYQRLGGYDGIAAVAGNLLPRLMADALLGRFWQNRGDDGLGREKQLLIDFLCANSGGPLTYVGRNMLTTHKGMVICEKDWANFTIHLNSTLDHFQVEETEKSQVCGFIESLKGEIVDK